ncbi:MAG: uracil-DNA glycosylase family protein [Desulfonatronovibrio sp.]
MKIHDLEICKKYRFVEGEGPLEAEIMLIGQNPGQEENKTGRPFVGRSGRYLDQTLESFGLNRDNLFLTSIVKCKTPGNRKPTQKEIQVSIPYLVRQIKTIKPSVIVLLGRVAWNTPRFDSIKYIETYHPAAAMRFPRIRKKYLNDFRKISELLRRTSG